MIAVVDYGMGNLRSMAKAIEHVGGEPVLTSDEAEIRAAERIVLPGVGAFGEAMENLRSTGLVDVSRTRCWATASRSSASASACSCSPARPSSTAGTTAWAGSPPTSLPLAITAPEIRVPHTGWNDIELCAAAGTPLARVRPSEAFYFNHSLHLVPDDESVIAAQTWHGERVVAAIARDNVCATQFHPEKSQQAGLELLADFVYWEPATAAHAIRTSTP